MRERRCIVTGEVCPEEKLVRFVVGPEGVVPDVEAKLPGRGMWVKAERAILTRAAKGSFAKAAKASVTVPPDLTALVERLLVQRMRSSLGLARRAGRLVLGFDNVFKALGATPPLRVLVEASDGAKDGRRKLAAAAAARGLQIETIDCLTKDELSLALGRENVIHAAVKLGPLADRLLFDSARLLGLRALSADGTAGQKYSLDPARNERNA